MIEIAKTLANRRLGAIFGTKPKMGCLNAKKGKRRHNPKKKKTANSCLCALFGFIHSHAVVVAQAWLSCFRGFVGAQCLCQTTSALMTRARFAFGVACWCVEGVLKVC